MLVNAIQQCDENTNVENGEISEIEGFDENSKETVGINILTDRSRAYTGLGNRKVLHQPVLLALTGEDEIGIDPIGIGAELRRERKIACKNIAGRDVAVA